MAYTLSLKLSGLETQDNLRNKKVVFMVSTSA